MIEAIFTILFYAAWALPVLFVPAVLTLILHWLLIRKIFSSGPARLVSVACFISFSILFVAEYPNIRKMAGLSPTTIKVNRTGSVPPMYKEPRNSQSASPEPISAQSSQIIGFVYIDSDGRDGAEYAIQISDDQKWRLVSSSAGKGVYDKVLSSGNVSSDGQLEGLPVGTYAGAKKVWKTGGASYIQTPN